MNVSVWVFYTVSLILDKCHTQWCEVSSEAADLEKFVGSSHFSMCRQNSISGRLENTLHQDRTHSECFSQSKCLELLGLDVFEAIAGLFTFLYFCLNGENFPLILTPVRVLMAYTEWLPGVWLRHFSTTCAVHIENCGGLWLSGCRSSVAEHWLHKLGVLGSIPGDCQPSIFASKKHLIFL